VAFLTDQPIQPIVIRYTNFISLPVVTPNELAESDFTWLWSRLCCPGTVCDVRYLNVVTSERLTGKAPREKADMVQLVMANELGIKAISRSNREMFAAQKKPM
jgi:hypothetical protein